MLAVRARHMTIAAVHAEAGDSVPGAPRVRTSRFDRSEAVARLTRSLVQFRAASGWFQGIEFLEA
jgi:hypothetical protein